MMAYGEKTPPSFGPRNARLVCCCGHLGALPKESRKTVPTCQFLFVASGDGSPQSAYNSLDQQQSQLARGIMPGRSVHSCLFPMGIVCVGAQIGPGTSGVVEDA